MLKDENRLKSRRDFTKLRKYGQTIFTPLFNFSFIDPSPQKRDFTEPLRLGFITSTNLDKRSTVRNRNKRLVREAVRLFLKKYLLPGKYSGFLGVFIIRKHIIGKTYEEVSLEVNKVLSKVFKL